ncbi:MAG: hypothetical protein MI725_00435 [Pirellulales bacterium]|nr:hypothetical protein [Pirellulales bacterium]
MTSTLRLFLILAGCVAIVSLGGWAVAAGGGCCCPHCGCDKIKKVTRLVTSFEEVEMPAYHCLSTKSFRPAKGLVDYTCYRSDKFYTLHTKWCCRESCSCEEHCEDIKHCVDKNPCDGKCKCYEEHHHKKHYHYELACTSRGCVSCELRQGCKTLYGASPKGCFCKVCTKQPTGEVCRCTVPVVRWVTFHVCPDCKGCCSSETPRRSQQREERLAAR